jgi:FkbM family methyltransferase
MNDVLPKAAPAIESIVRLAVDGHEYVLVLPDCRTDHIQSRILQDLRPYEEEMLADMARRVARDTLVLDIGANIGNHTMYLAAVAGCQVEAFEPNTALCDALEQSTGLNGLSHRINVHRVGVGARRGLAHFAQAIPTNLGAQRLDLGEGDIRIVVLDDLQFRAPVGMMKIDVEGMELDVLQGATGLLERDRPLVYVECLNEKEFVAVGRLLEGLAYSYWDTFNVSPTHLFRPAETLGSGDHASRLALLSALTSHRSSQALNALHSKLTKAYNNQRQSAAARAAMQARMPLAEAEIDDHLKQATELQSRLRESDGKREALENNLSGARAMMQAQAARLEGAMQEAAAQREACRKAVAALQASRRKASAQRAAWTNEKQRLTSRLGKQERQIQIMQQEQSRLKALARQRGDRIHELDAEARSVRDSASFRTGAAFVAASRSLPDAARLPVKLWRIFSSAAKQRRLEHDAAAAERSAFDAEIDGVLRSPGLLSAPVHDDPQVQAPAPAPAPRAVPLLAPVRDVSQLKIACVVDNFTFHAFAPECELLALSAHGWASEVSAFAPDLVFIESAWSDADGGWNKKVSDISPELLQLLAWCNDKGIPTAFWCREDPVHFARFLPVARRADHVFTTDIDCIARYRNALAHDRVHLLPFAAQPRLHNPIQTVDRAEGFCFAGSYYTRYAERQTDFATLATVARKLGSLTIYDRNADCPRPHDFEFPAEYASEIRGSLPYEQIDQAYKGFRFGVTVNTIKQSQTTFARRAFELLACNTIVASNFSRALRLFFGDLVISSDDPVELEHRLRPLLQDEHRQRRLRHLALRKTLEQHTYAHRLAYVAQKLSGRRTDLSSARVLAIGTAIDERSRDRLLVAFKRQAYPLASLAIMTSLSPPAGCSARVTFVPDPAALEHLVADADYVAPLSADDYYGPRYLSDLILAVRFASHDVLTKAAHYALGGAGDAHLLQHGQQFRRTDQAMARSSLIKADVALRDLANGIRNIDGWALQTPSMLAVDEFEYCRGAATAGEGFDARAVSAELELFQGLHLQAELEPMAEAVAAPQRATDSGGPIVLPPAELVALFPPALDSDLEATLTGQQILLRSKLGAEQNRYIALHRRFSATELGASQERIFQLEADTHVDLRTVLVFFDGGGRKTSYVMHPAGGRHGFTVPAGTASLRFALRIQGSGDARIGSLTLGEARDFPMQILPTARHLLVTKQYPSYADLYRFGFVHARVRAYRREGVSVDVLKTSVDPKVRFREFEDINVIEGNAAHLDACLGSGRYDSVLIHVVKQKTWNTVREHLDRVRVVIWAHGEEMQPWWRRAMNFPTEGLRDQARRASDARLAMWREILSSNHPNLRVVFISNKQAEEALSDLRLDNGSIKPIVIPNFIDGELFSYEEKPSEQRNRILSIRPYASRVYANDVMVKTILELAGRPFFDQLGFTIVGDGRLFDETVAPLRHLPNVQIMKAFVTQREIAALHKTHGVFLVPSRMDTQGVSRDEAMASGLVPVTTRIAAIPEFVDECCAFLAPPEDPRALADAIERLHDDPELHRRMSAAAAQRVRRQSGHAATIARELALVEGRSGRQPETVSTRRSARVAIYGDLNLNGMDGPAIWAASLAEVVAGIDDVRVTLLLKARIQRTHVLTRLLDLAPRVQIVEPPVGERSAMSVAGAIDQLVALDATYVFRCFILRGLDLCSEATRTDALHGRIWAYLTDIPQSTDAMDPATHARIVAIVAASELILCQTPQMRDHLEEQFPSARNKTRLLPPMIPEVPAATAAPPAESAFRLAYAGRFAPNWGIREMFAAFAELRTVQPDAELHVFGDKVYNPPEDSSFRASTLEALSSTQGLFWHRAVDRDQLLRELGSMHACWSFRDPAYERGTLELSTKVLEFASIGVPPILTRSAVNEHLLGTDYPLFVDDARQAARTLLALARDRALASKARSSLAASAQHYSFKAVRKQLAAQGLFPHLTQRVEQRSAVDIPNGRA